MSSVPRTENVSLDARHHSWILAARDQIEDSEARQASFPRRKSAAVPAPSADFFPGYELRGEIHRGGQGIVYQAIQKSTGRTVAIKMLREAAFAGPTERSRFEREVQVLAALKHPNIVTIHDSGNADGHLYFVMDFIAGRPLDAYVAGEKPPVRDVLRLFATICDAVNAAHVLGIVHRDLKPGNIRVGASGTPFVLDFGLARLADAPVATHKPDSPPPMTVTGQFVGSLPWATPEQADGDAQRVDRRSDVYSLGVVLFQILTGRFPYSVSGKMRQVLESIAGATPTDPRSLSNEIDDEIATIVLTCLAKDPTRRYQSAGDLAADIRRYLSGEPIAAKRDSAWYMLRKTARRYRWQVSVAAAFLLLASGAAILLSILYGHRGVLLTEVQRQRDKAMTAESLSRERLRAAEYESYVANIAAAEAAIAANDGGVAHARLQAASADDRNWEWRYLLRQADQSIATLHGPADLITKSVQFSPDGRHVAAGFWMEWRPGALRVWDRSLLGPGQNAHADSAQVFDLNFGGPVGFGNNGKQLVFATSDGDVVFWDLSTRRELRRVQLDADPADRITSISPDASYGFSSQAVWDLRSGQRLHEHVIPSPQSMTTPAAAGRRMVVGLKSGAVSVRDVANGRELARTPRQDQVVYGAVLSADGRRVAVAKGESGLIELWEVTGEPPVSADEAAKETGFGFRTIREWHSGDQRVGIPAFSPDGRFLAAPSFDKTVRIFSTEDGYLRATLRGHTAGVICVDLAADGRLAASGARNGEIKLWDLQSPPAMRQFQSSSGPIDSIAFTPAGDLLADCESICVFDANSGRIQHQCVLPVKLNTSGAILGPGDAEATFASSGGCIHIWNFGAAGTRELRMHKSYPKIAGIRKLGTLMSADKDEVIIWDWAGGRALRRFAGPGKSVESAAISADGARVALGLKGGALRIFDVGSGSPAAAGPNEHAHEDVIQSITFSPDGRHAVTGSYDGTIKLWDAANGDLIWTASPQIGDVWCVRWSPDSSRLAAGGRDRSVRILDAANGRELLALRGPTGTIMSLDFSPDGRRIVAGSWSREIFIWDAAAPVGQPADVQSANGTLDFSKRRP